MNNRRPVLVDNPIALKTVQADLELMRDPGMAQWITHLDEISIETAIHSH